MKRFPVIILLFAGLSGLIVGQQPGSTDSAGFYAMKLIQPLSGDWTGSGWVQIGREKHNFKQKEVVAGKANGTVIVIDGQGTDETSGRIVHHAFAVISFDVLNKKYLMRAFLANGNYVDADIRVRPDGTIIWGYKHPQAGEIRYTISTADGNWDEKGEMNRDGTSWIPFFHMNLEKN